MLRNAKNTESSYKEEAREFGLDLSKIASGTLISQIILVLLTPIITRLYDPSVYGIASVLIAITNILLVVCCFRYEQAIILPQDNRDASSLLLGCFLLLSIFSILLVPFIVFFGEAITTFLHLSDILPYLFLLPIVIFVGGLFLSMKFWNLRKRRFGTQATTQVIQYTFYPGFQIGFGISGFASVGSLILSDVIAKLPCIFVYAYQMFKDDLKILSSGLSFKNIRLQFVKYKKLPLLNTWAQLLYLLSWQLPILLLSAFFSSEIAGQYSLAYRTLLLPLSLIGGTIGQVLFQRASIAVHNNSLSPLVEDIVAIIMIVSILPLLLLGILGEDIFSIIFSSKWALAGTFVQVLSVWMIVWFVASPLMNLINILGIQGFGLRYNFISVVVRTVALLLGFLSGNVYFAVALFMLVSLVLDSYIDYMLISKSGCSSSKIFHLVAKPVSISLGLVALVFVIYHVSRMLYSGWEATYGIIGFAMICGIGYFVYLFRQNKLVQMYLKAW